MNLQNKLYYQRKKHNLSQALVAEKLNVSRQAISKWESATASPSKENMIALSKLYGVPIDYWMNDEIPSTTETFEIKSVQISKTSTCKEAIIRTIISTIAVIVFLIIGIIRNTIATHLLILLVISLIVLPVFICRWVYKYVVNKKTK